MKTRTKVGLAVGGLVVLGGSAALAVAVSNSRREGAKVKKTYGAGKDPIGSYDNSKAPADEKEKKYDFSILKAKALQLQGESLVLEVEYISNDGYDLVIDEITQKDIGDAYPRGCVLCWDWSGCPTTIQLAYARHNSPHKVAHLGKAKKRLQIPLCTKGCSTDRTYIMPVIVKFADDLVASFNVAYGKYAYEEDFAPEGDPVIRNAGICT